MARRKSPIHLPPAADGLTRYRTLEESGMNNQDNANALTALHVASSRYKQTVSAEQQQALLPLPAPLPAWPSTYKPSAL